MRASGWDVFSPEAFKSPGVGLEEAEDAGGDGGLAGLGLAGAGGVANRGGDNGGRAPPTAGAGRRNEKIFPSNDLNILDKEDRAVRFDSQAAFARFA